MDGEEHLKHRRVMQPNLMPGSVRELEPVIRDIALSFIDKLEAGGPEIDFADEIASRRSATS